ncbi:MAG: ABC transporter permease [Candidatus Mcinerneyibacterium aminivorans]|uniref:ABC transporter permease n=1 Tax=Candidatus Mcinerneyibacterium aminivorans TaxID=2703815 RepID=A0A5D0MKP1_9BACT|nr:MAG: ABC transporter permease [Candidatus Mcinerneyibacterium aminivorans]
MPTTLIRKFLNYMSESKKKYGIQWWILIIGLVIILFVTLTALFPGFFAPYSADNMEAGKQLTGPSSQNILGTDNLGRDVFSRIIYGSKTILGVAFIAALISSLIGVPLGLISGFVGGLFDKILSLIMDSIFSFPGLILAIALAAMLGPGIVNITGAVAVIYIPQYFRQVRGQTLSLKEEVFVEAGRAIGASKFRLLRKYIFPNVLATIVVIFSLNIADAIMTEAALSYLGLGLPAGIPDWGRDIAMGKKYLASGYWWIITFPGVAIVTLTLGFTMVGESLSELLNPKLRDK